MADKSPLLDIPSIKVGVFDQMDFKKSMNTFHYMQHNDPHSIRRRLILAKHPEVQTLFGKDPISLPLALGVILSQLIIAYLAKDASWAVYLTVLYFIGGTLNHTLNMLIHDLTHFSCFETVIFNKFLAIMCNIPTGIPSAMSFGRYHKDHHQYMDEPGVDPDLPSEWEVQFFRTTFRKFAFVLFMPFFYAIRPFVITPKTPDVFEIFNILVIFFMNFVFVKTFGWSFLIYLLFASLIGMGFHPVAMHVIAEHYEFVQGQETYSYYGILNIPNLNVGYHIEHHDFPMIPWRKLPALKKMAPEFYENLPHHDSYVAVAIKFIFEKNIGPWSRVGRIVKDEKKE